MTEVLQAFKDKLKVIIQDKSKDDLDRQVADFYLKTLTPYDDRVLKRQRGFGRGIGGTGDNIISMPVIERDETGIVLNAEGKPKIIHCVFDDFQSYLNHIERCLPVKRCISRWKVMPSCVNGLTMDEYQAIWMRSQGIERE